MGIMKIGLPFSPVMVESKNVLPTPGPPVMMLADGLRSAAVETCVAAKRDMADMGVS
jgi:hypothetical protein